MDCPRARDKVGELSKQELVIHERIPSVHDVAALLVTALGVEPAAASRSVIGIEADGVGGPRLGDVAGIGKRELTQALALMKYDTSMAHGFFVARRKTVRMCRSDRPRRTRACRCASAAPRSFTRLDQWPFPNRAVSAPATEFCSAAIAGTSRRVASRNFSSLPTHRARET